MRAGTACPHSCHRLCEFIDENRRPSTIADDIGVARYRTSETCNLEASNPVVRTVNQALGRALGLPAELGEPLQDQRYAVGQEFREHTDTFNPNGFNYFEQCAVPGQRTWTAMIYLNRPEAGGATRFKKIGKTFQPATGTMLAWNNLLPDGQPNPLTLHQGMKVRAGVKYIVTKWYRERAA